MIPVAICEDNIHVQAQIENDIKDMTSGYQTEVFSSGEDLLAFLDREGMVFGVYLMDISLPGLSGIETASIIRSRDLYALIIYITDYKEYVYKVFETLPYRFITKPIDPDVFRTVLTDAFCYLTDRRRVFNFHIERTQYHIPFQEILYFESHLRQITLHTNRDEYTFYGKLRDLPELLNPVFFVRTHTSYIVNLEYIHSISDTEIVLHSGVCIPVSRKYRDAVRKKHLEYMKWRVSK